MSERKETEILFNSIFILGLDNDFVVKSFPEPVEMAVLPGWGIKGIPGIIFDKLWI